MKRWRCAFILLATLSSTSPLAHAQCPGFWEQFRMEICRLRNWPEPYVRTDRQAVRDPFVIMKDNGWRVNNTLSDPFFASEQHTLTRAGEIKVRWIATQAPANRRIVYVLRGESPDITETRVQSVHDYLAKILTDGTQPEVLLTDIVPPDGSGEYFDQVNRQFNSSVPAPRLSSPSGGSGGSSGGSGTSN